MMTRAWRRSIGVPFLTAAFLMPSPAGPAVRSDDFLHVAPLRVERPGWIRVPLDPGLQAAGMPHRDWQVFGVDGAPLAVETLTPLTGTIPVRTLSVERDAGGWSLLFDLGVTPVRHAELRIEPMERTAAPDCRLEGSTDGVRWQALATADLFWLGEGTSLRQSAIQYEPTGARYLRLRWPSTAGFPEFRRVEAVALPEPPGGDLHHPLVPRFVHQLVGETEYLLMIPAVPTKELRLGLNGSGVVGFRLFGLGEHRWILIEEGERDLTAEAPVVSVSLGGRDPRPGILRLVVFDHGGTEVRLDSAAVMIPPLWLLFEAPVAGEYTLACGSWRPPEGGNEGGFDRNEITGTVADVIPGEVGDRPPPPVPDRLTAPADPLDEGRAGMAWTVVADDAEPGTWVHLELPEEVYETTEAAVGRFRVAASGRLVPFLLREHELPSRAFDGRGLVPERRGASGHGILQVDLGPSARCLTQVEIRSPHSPLSMRYTAELRRHLRPGVESPPVFRHRSGDLACGQHEVLPCRDDFSLPRHDVCRILTVEFDGHREDLTFDLIGWRRRHVLSFVWPEGGEVTLVSGFEASTRPFPDLAAIQDRIDVAPGTTARLETGPPDARTLANRRRNLIFLVVALLVVSVGLVSVLVRTIRAGPRQ